MRSALNRDFTGIDPYTTQYKGRSLQRVSVTAASNDPANWLASPLPGSPSPGAANSVTRSVPKPVVVGINVIQNSNESAVIRLNQAVRINATFSFSEALSNVQLEYFIENHETFNEVRSAIAMNAIGNGQYTLATPIPGQADRAIVRYRIKADRGSGSEVVSPRSDDPQIVPVTATTKEAWHSYFVQPTRTATRPAYDFFISTANTNTLNSNASQNPKRVLTPDPPGYPRDEPFDGYYPTFSQYNPINYPTGHSAQVERDRASRICMQWCGL